MKKTAYVRCLERTLNKRAGVMNDAIQWALLHPQAAGAIAGGVGVGLPAALIGGKKNWLRNLLLGGGAAATAGAFAGKPVRDYAVKKMVEPAIASWDLPGKARKLRSMLPSEQLKKKKEEQARLQAEKPA